MYTEEIEALAPPTADRYDPLCKAGICTSLALKLARRQEKKSRGVRERTMIIGTVELLGRNPIEQRQNIMRDV